MAELSRPILVVGCRVSGKLSWADGPQVVACASAKLALETLRANASYSAVFYNVCLPDMSAAEFLCTIRSGFKGLPIVVVTESSNIKLGILAMFSGASDYVQTPLKRSVILASLERASNRTTIEYHLKRSRSGES